MGRDGNGNAWRHRQWRPHGRTGIRRNLGARKLAEEPQFGFDELYISPFRWRRRFDEEGRVNYEAVDRWPLKTTGVRLMDAYLWYLADGESDLEAFADKHGLRREDIDSMVFILTGMRGVDFRQRFQMRQAADLMRYTSLTLAEVARRSGLGSANNLYLSYKRDFNLAPGYRRLSLRKEGDVGRFRL